MGSCRVSLGLLILTVMTGFFGSSEAYVFVVGDRSGWVRQPSEDYNRWAGRYRFQVNDSLLFKYQKGADSVLVVTRDDYTSCNTKSPLVSLTDGDSIFTFDRSGPFFFISGNPDNCNNGQKLIAVVLAERNRPPTPTPQPPPSSPSPPVSTPPPSTTMPPPTAQSPSGSLAPGASPSGTNPGNQAPAPSRGFAPAGRSYSRAMALGLSGIVSYLMFGKVLV